MDNNPYRPPSVESDPSPLTDSGEILPPASRWQRFFASILDSLIVFGPLILFSFYSPFDRLNEFLLSETLINEAFYALVGFMIFLLLNLHLIRNHDQTIGKLALGIKVTDLQGRSPTTLNQVGIRYSFYLLISAVPVVGSWINFIDILFIFGAERRCLHDRLAGTQVVQCR